ncbi:hypothetical protein Cgig2_017517 [Carnegiea gigantea]|uniref:Uncharacterized protein n=1 Tax=Carnegiea gigantea TaxID=171969 RepID=A0A9Q1QBZ3_9CARY|nr:hypothetical protein Cgig2_017517 [Carnegiea gigantea]
MVEKILERGDHGEEFKRDFILHIISTSIIRGMDDDYFFQTLKLLMDERDAKIDGFQQQYIRQLILLNKEIKLKRSFPKSMERVGHLIGKNIRRLFMEEKLNLYTEPLASTHGSPPVPKEPSTACGSEREPLMGGPIDLIKEDVYAMFAPPMSQLEVQVASTCEPTTEHIKTIKQRRTG